MNVKVNVKVYVASGVPDIQALQIYSVSALFWITPHIHSLPSTYTR